MATNKSKIVRRYVGDTYFDVRMTFVHTGEGRKRKVESTSYAVFHTKHSLKGGFKCADDAEKFAIAIFPSYNNKRRSFREPK